MANKFWRKNSENDPLSLSYHEGVERLAGVTDHIAFKVPSKILENRKQFWSELFHKYTEQVLDDTELDIRTFKPCIRESESKSLSLVQYWVNTGYLPYNNTKFHMDKDAQSETVVSLSEEYCSLSDHHVVEQKANAEHVEFNLKASSSSSSVDTAAYILSNTNTTNKAETMAIVEGAKHRRVIDSQCGESVEVIQVTTDKQHQKSNKDIVLDKNGNSYEPHSPSSSRIAECELQQDVSRVGGNIAHLQDISAAEANKNILPESKSNDRSNKNSPTTTILGNVDLSPIEQSYFENEITSSQDSTLTNRNRKKLYTGRDSPVDLLNMKTSNKYIIPKLKRYLHPALDFGYKHPRKYKICKQRRRKNSHLCNNLLNDSQFSIFSYKHKSIKKRKNFSDISMAMRSNLSKINDKHSKSSSVTDCSTKDKSLIERDNFHCANTKILNNGSERTKSKLTTSMDHLEKDNKITHNEKLPDLCPVVCLKRLSKFDIEKYKRSTSVSKNRNNRFMRQLSKNLRNTKPAVCRSKPRIQKHKKSNKTFGTYEILNPVVLLETLKEFELHNYKTVPNSRMNMDNLSPIVRLERLTEADICRYKRSNAIKTQSKNASLPDTVHSQDIHVKNNQHLQMIPSYCSESSTSIINLVYEDTASDQSTLLFCKCAPDVSLENSSATNLSISSANSSQSVALFMGSGKHMLKSKPTVARKVEIKSKVDMIGNKVDVSSSDKGSRENAKRLTRNQKTMCVTENKTIKNIHDINKSPKMHLRSSTINVGAFKTKNVWKSDAASSSDTLSDIYDNKNTNSNNIFLSDEDDDFVKLVHCPEDVQQLKLRQRYKILNQDFNSKVEEVPCTQSTLLFCKSAPDVSLENSSTTNLSVSSANSSQSDALFMGTGKHMLKSKPTVARKVDMIGNKVDLSSSDKGSRKNAKRLTRNQKNKCVTENKTIKNIHDINKSPKMHLRSSTINVGAFKTKNVWKSDAASSSDTLSDIYDNKNTNSNNIFLSDEDDDFVKLVHCPEDVQQSKLRQRYKILNQDFNSKVEKAKGDRLNTSNISIKRLRKIGKKWKNSKVFSESTTDESQLLEDFTAITPPKLPKSWSPGRGQCNKELSIQQVVVGSNNTMSSNVGSITGKPKSNIRRLCFKTKIFDSDSESFTV